MLTVVTVLWGSLVDEPSRQGETMKNVHDLAFWKDLAIRIGFVVAVIMLASTLLDMVG
jgi:hypothetical protein